MTPLIMVLALAAGEPPGVSLEDFAAIKSRVRIEAEEVQAFRPLPQQTVLVTRPVTREVVTQVPFVSTSTNPSPSPGTNLADSWVSTRPTSARGAAPLSTISPAAPSGGVIRIRALGAGRAGSTNACPPSG